MTLWLPLLLLLLSNIPLQAGVLTYHQTLPVPEVTPYDGYDHFSMAPGPVYGDPGTPELPHYGHQLLLPPGEEAVSVTLENPQWQVIPGRFYLAPAQPPLPLSRKAMPPFTPPDSDIYSSTSTFPTDPVGMFRTDFLSGHGIVSIEIVTARYQPAAGSIEVLISYDLKVESSATPRAQEAYGTMLKRGPEISDRIVSRVDNAEALSSYGSLDETDEVNCEYLIITNQEYAPYYSTLRDHYLSRGLQTEIITVEEITAQFTGIDLADKIRNCIRSYYQNDWIKYVLLGGDTEIIPKRGLYASLGGETDEDIAADIYFSNLDGNWNNDGDNRWGESNEADLIAEVAIGRFSADTPAEAVNMIQKTTAYQNAPVASDLEKGLMVGEDLGWTVWGSDIKEEVHLGGNYWGYTTAGFPQNFDVATLYETTSFSFSALAHLAPLLNGGTHLVNHMGHGNTDWVLKFSTNQVNDNNLTNNGTNHGYYIAYSQACYSGSFDNRTTGGSYTSDCICEKFTTIANGSVAFICNSRYGWGSGTTTNGPSQYFDRQFFDALFGEHIYTLGWINADSKEDNIPFIGSASFWCYYELNILGDPALDVWTAQPQTFNPQYPASITLGSTQFDVNVGVPNAFVAISGAGGVMGTGVSQGNGVATIFIQDPIVIPEELTLSITCHNFLPFHATIPAVAANGPFVIVSNPTFSDAEGGDGDSLADLGETLSFSMDFQNVGTEIGYGMLATLSCTDNSVTIDQGEFYLGEMQINTLIQAQDAFQATLTPAVRDGETLTFLVTIRDNRDSTWVSDFEVTAHAPGLQLTSWSISDGNNNALFPGESAMLSLSLTNQGSCETTDLSVQLLTDNPSVTVSNPVGQIAALNPGAEGTLDNLQFTLDAGIADPSTLVLYLIASDTRNYREYFLIETPVGGVWNDMESGELDWTHTNVSPAFGDQWNLSPNLNHTPGGSHAWYCGQNMQYGTLLDAGLTTGEYPISGVHELHFYHWMSAELSVLYPGYCYDGGIVEMSLNGSDFQQITPRGGYPYRIRQSSQPGPFPQSLPCYSGTIVWSEAVFDLQGTGTVRFRFRFGSDGATNSVGWIVDDLRLVKVSNPEAPGNLNAQLEENEVYLTWNTPGVIPGLNPASPKEQTGERRDESLELYYIYRNSVKIDSIQALTYTDNLSGFQFGSYYYQVSGRFSGVEGGLSQPVFVDYVGIPNRDKPAIPEQTSLASAYPNPFNPSVNLKLDLAKTEFVSLAIYDLQGRRVASLVNQRLEAGTYEFTWNAKNFSSGLYLVSMNAGNYTNAQKILLLK
jgi:hypothetical protein